MSPTTAESDDGTVNRVIAEIRVPATAVGLASTLATLSTATVEAEQLVPNSHDPIPYVWVTNVSPHAFETAVADDPTIAAARRTAAFEAGTLYELEWTDAEGVVRTWSRERDVPVLETEADAGTEAWHLKLRLDSRDELTALQTFCDGHDIDFDLRRLYSLTRPKMGQYNVSEKQLVAMLTAYEQGYFEIPRGCRLADVADRLDLSTEATSERLRRGLTNLVSNSLVIGEPTAVGVGTDE